LDRFAGRAVARGARHNACLMCNVWGFFHRERLLGVVRQRWDDVEEGRVCAGGTHGDD
jgi:hypothetical protein